MLLGVGVSLEASKAEGCGHQRAFLMGIISWHCIMHLGGGPRDYVHRETGNCRLILFNILACGHMECSAM